ncbi:glycosyltransferase family 2 protein [Nocardioides sp.]|uniref:glycosyltransferase family 2 protein n=1 Tax=Nocardioides sp. TaxID=35761 RepID=UPI00260F8A3C|nr:glycosyltransferase family 2 protein [Nocardioides sp.]
MPLRQRLVGVGTMTAAGLGALVLWSAVALTRTPDHDHLRVGRLPGGPEVTYDLQGPGVWLLVVSIGLAVIFAVGVAVVERRTVTRTRRAVDDVALPLAPRHIMDATRGVYAGPVTVTVLIPAHNEEGCLADTLRSLHSQEPPPERVIVVADNCTDATVDIARAEGAEVFETRGNTHKKAGALNQALREVLVGLGDNDLVMVMDADTTLDPGFLAGVKRRMTLDRALMAVGGLFYGEDGAGLRGQFQRNEYMRYQRELKRRRGRVFVLTGTATAFRARALREVAAHRGTVLPGVPGDVYDVIALTEDNELTIALKCLGALMISPAECTVVTEVMPTWRTLWNQRLRWQRGALENLGAYGPRPATMRYWAQQLGIGYGVFALGGYVLLMVVLVATSPSWVWFPFWMGVGGVFVIERVVTVWKGGWAARLLALALFPELFYAMFLNLVHIKGIWDLARAKEAAWTHLAAPTREEAR